WRRTWAWRRLEVLDVNDNAPEVWVTSLSVPVPEDAAVGTVVALLSVSDRDSGANGRVRCAVWPAAPFGLVATFAGSYSLVLREALDRERVSEYEVEVRAEDGGAPALRASRGVRVPVSDVNDNAPAFRWPSEAELCRRGCGLLSRGMKSLPTAMRGATTSALRTLGLAGVQHFHPSLLKGCQTRRLWWWQSRRHYLLLLRVAFC
uniref:Cadherin domain-containing protein n=1 Tax=Aquila chrysaetos chrysaetos TaxID=223781 RepID=A0A663EMC3_AQUCH